jgi:hypothetical protein
MTRTPPQAAAQSSLPEAKSPSSFDCSRTSECANNLRARSTNLSTRSRGSRAGMPATIEVATDNQHLTPISSVSVPVRWIVRNLVAGNHLRTRGRGGLPIAKKSRCGWRACAQKYRGCRGGWQIRAITSPTSPMAIGDPPALWYTASPITSWAGDKATGGSLSPDRPPGGQPMFRPATGPCPSAGGHTLDTVWTQLQLSRIR